MKTAFRFRDAAAWLVAASALTAPALARAGEKVLVLADARVPAAAETAAQVARHAGFEVVPGAADLATTLLALGCARTDAACLAAGTIGTGLRWILVVEAAGDVSAGDPPSRLVVVRRIDRDAGTEVKALSGPVAGGPEGVAALVELLTAVVGKPAAMARVAAADLGDADDDSPTALAAPRKHPLDPPGIAAAAAGAALLGLAGASAWRLGAVQREFATAPNESLADLTTLDRMSKRGKAWAATANLSVVAGAVALLTGVALLVVPRLLPPPARATVFIEQAPGGLAVRW